MSERSLALITVIMAAGLLCGDVATAQVDQQVEWNALGTSGLVDLGAQLHADGAVSAPRRALLVQHIASRHMTDDAAVRGVPLEHWRHYVRDLHADLSAADRITWATRLRKAHAGSPQAAAALPAGDLLQLVETLVMLGDTDSRELLLDRVMNATDWQTLSAKDLASAANQLWVLKSRRGAALRRMAAHMETAYLTDNQAVQAASLRDWENLVWKISVVLSSDQRRQWATKLRAAYADTPEAMASLDAQDMLSLAMTLGDLGDASADAMMAELVAASDDWQALKPLRLPDVILPLARLGQAGKPGLARVADHLESDYLSTPSMTAKATPEEWGIFVHFIGRGLPKEKRALWVSKLRAAFVDDSAVFASLTSEDLLCLSNALSNLGEAESGVLLVSRINNSTDWHAFDGKGLRGLAMQLASIGDVGHGALGKLADHLESQYLSTPSMTAKATPEEWDIFVHFIGRGLPKEKRALWGSKIRAAFVDDSKVFASLTSEDILYLSNSLANLGEAESGGLLVSRINNSTDWHSLDGKGLRDIAMRLAQIGHLGHDARAKLVEHITNTYTKDAAAVRKLTCRQWGILIERLELALSSETRASWGVRIEDAYTKDAQALDRLSAEDLKFLAQALALLGCQEKGQEVAALACQAASQSGTCGPYTGQRMLFEVAECLYVTGAVGPGKGYVNYANAMATLARDGKLTVEDELRLYEIYGAPLATSQARDIVQAELMDGEGNPRLPVAHALSWAHAIDGTLNQWHTYLDERITEAADSDTQARWMLARANAEAVAKPGVGLRGRAVEAGMRKAMATASSVATKVECLRHLAAVMAEAWRFDESLALLAKAADDAVDESQKAEIREIVIRISKLRATRTGREVRFVRDRAEAMERKAAEAKAGGDAASENRFLGRARQLRSQETSLRNQIGL